MAHFSLGDLAQTFMLQRRGAALKMDMSRLNDELATGQVSDVKSVLAGNIGYLTDIENDLATLEGYRIATTEAAQFSQAVQTALDRVGTSAGNLGTTLVTMSPSAVGPILNQFSSQAMSELETIVSALNTKTGGRALFSGTATDQKAIVGADTILTGLRGAIAGLTNAQDIIDAADQWFDDPAGFEAAAYSGGSNEMSPFRLAKGEEVQLSVKASDQILRDTLKHVALAAIAGEATGGTDTEAHRTILEDSGRKLFNAQGELTAVQAKVGTAEARIETLATRNASEENALLIAKGALIQVDPYEAATELEAVQFQLQSLYAVTARMSDMSFLNFIR